MKRVQNFENNVNNSIFFWFLNLKLDLLLKAEKMGRKEKFMNWTCSNSAIVKKNCLKKLCEKEELFTKGKLLMFQTKIWNFSNFFFFFNYSESKLKISLAQQSLISTFITIYIYFVNIYISQLIINFNWFSHKAKRQIQFYS